MSQDHVLFKVIRHAALLYVAASLAYTTFYLITGIRISSPSSDIVPHHSPAQPDGMPTGVPDFIRRYLNLQPIPWSNEDASLAETTTEQFFLGKTFSDSFGPSKVIPYYFKAEESSDKEEVTIATLVTSNRFPVLGRLASHYKGPVSVALHITDDESKDSILKSLNELYDSNPDMRRYVDLHLIVDVFDRQFNMWRNVAKFFARTDYIMMLDVDFFLCTDFRKSLNAHPFLKDLLRQGEAAVVVPAFEFINDDDGEDHRKFPRTKKGLMEILNKNKIDMFHRFWKPGHGATNYQRWYRATQPYKTNEYTYSYEPYVIFKKEGTPWCDERFAGYGANKAACLYEIYLSGIDFWILPDDFLIHQTHHYPITTRAKERTYNKKLYDYYREETCLRYARMMIAADEWNTPKANNVKRECSKISGFQGVIGKLHT